MNDPRRGHVRRDYARGDGENVGGCANLGGCESFGGIENFGGSENVGGCENFGGVASFAGIEGFGGCARIAKVSTSKLKTLFTMIGFCHRRPVSVNSEPGEAAAIER